MSKSLLACREVTLAGTPGRVDGIEALNLELGEGTCGLMECREEVRLSLADLLTGLARPLQGQVLFEGQNWADLTPSVQERCRGRMRLQVEDGGWISNLNMIENITLSTRRHSKQPESEIVQEAEELAYRFGMEKGVPEGHPHELNRSILRRCGWIRLGMGAPALVYLELIKTSLRSEEFRLLEALLREKQKSGSAILVLTSTPAFWKESELEISRRMTYDNGRFDERILS